MPDFTRNLQLTVEADCPDEADGKIRHIAFAIADSDALPTGVTATAPHVEPDWLDDMANVADADHVDVAWTVRNEHARVLFGSDMTLTAQQAAAMFRGIGEAS